MYTQSVCQLLIIEALPTQRQPTFYEEEEKKKYSVDYERF